MDVVVSLAGSGPAAEAVEAACTDVDVAVERVSPTALSGRSVAVVVAPAGASVFDVADRAVDRWVAVEVGGVGGHPFDDLDAAVSVFSPESAGYADLQARVTSTGGGTADSPTGDRSAVRLAGAVAGRRLVRLLSGDGLGGTVVEVPGGERRFLPVPDPSTRDTTVRRDHRSASLEDSLARAERAVDDRVGLVTQVGERESFPVPYYLAATADTTVFSDGRAAEYAAGVDAEWNPAFMKALGEALERYSAGVYRTDAFDTDPVRERPDAVPPSRFVRPERFDGPTPSESVAWYEGVDLATDESVSLPAEFVHFPPSEERHKPAITTGLGLGNTGTEALLSGLYEVVERDATMLAWYSTFDPLGLSVDDDGFQALVGRARAEDLTVTPLLVTQDVDVPVVAVAVHREGDWPGFAMGSGADLDPASAARSALAEALQNWTELRSMGPEAAREEEGAIGRYGEFPRLVRRFVDVDATVPASDVGPEEDVAGADELDAVVSRVADAGLDAYAARITPRDVEELGFEAVRVLVPEAQPLFTEEPYFGERAERVPEELGFESRLGRPFHPYP